MNTDDLEGRQMAAKQNEPTGDEIEELMEFGYRNYDREQRVVVLTGEGIRNLLTLFNSMKREVRVLKEKVQTSIPMSLMADRAIAALKRNPMREQLNFQRTEDMLATWSAANGNAGEDVLRRMGDNYDEIMNHEQERQERQWFYEHSGKNINVNGPYNDQGTSHELHLKR